MSTEDEGGNKRREHARRSTLDRGQSNAGQEGAPHQGAAIGKRTLTEGAGGGYTELDAIAFFQSAADELRAQLDALARATTSGDQLLAITAAHAIRRCLESARGHAARMQAGSSSERLRELSELEAKAADAVRSACDAGLLGAAPTRHAPGGDGSRQETPAREPAEGIDSDERATSPAGSAEIAPRLATARRLVEQAAAALGAPTAPVYMNERARARTEAHGTHAVMSGGAILLHPDRFDPEQTGALETVAHELVHVVQLHTDSRQTDDRGDRDAEAEARRIAAQIAAGRAPDRPAIRLTAAEAADGGKKPSAAEPTLPPGVDYQPIGNGGDVLIRVAWLARDPAADLSKPWILAPTKWPHLLHALKAHAFWWMPDAAFAEAGTLRLKGPIDPKTEVVRVFLLPEVFRLIGLPPGSSVEWMFEEDGGYEIISSDVLKHVNDLPDGWSRKSVPFAVEELSRRRMYEKAGIAPPAKSTLSSRALRAHKQDAAIVTKFPADEMRAMLGPRWDAMVKTPASRSVPSTSPFEGIEFDNAISLRDRRYVIEWLGRIYGAAPKGSNAPRDLETLALLRRIDANPLRDKIRARIKQLFPDSAKLDWRVVARLVHDAQEEAAREAHGLANPTPTGSGRSGRYYDRPITGEVVNLGSLVSVDKEIALIFSTTAPHPFGFVPVAVKWIATPVGKPKEIVRSGTTRHFAHREPARWNVSFDKVGKYQIAAFVDHESYWPAHFDDTIIEVKTEQQRLDEVETDGFGELGAQTSRHGRNEFFEVSWTNDRFGDNKYTFGDLTEGVVPHGFKRRTLEDRIEFLAKNRAELEKLIRQYEGERKLDHNAKDVIRYARNALATLATTQERIGEDAKDLAPFEIRGAFLSEKNGIRSGPLNLIGLGGRQRGTDKTTVRIHDLSKLYEPKNAVYTGKDNTFREAIEEAFVDLCKGYPPGRVSILFEPPGDDGKPSHKTMGFELHTGTAWKGVKATVWDGKVQLAVNLVAAATSVFVPGAALVVIPVVLAYNATDTIDSLAELHRKGQATWKDGFEAGLSIGLDLLPFLGRMTKAGKLGATTLFALDLAQTATNVVVMTDKGIAQVNALRNGFIQDIARLADEIDELRRINDSDPRIAEKEKQKAELIAQARAQAAETFKEMAASGAVMLFTPVAFNHLVNGAATRTAKELEAGGMFVHEPGVEPRYHPETGRIHGDRSRLDEVKIKALQDAYVADAYRQHADAAQILGVAPEGVAIVRKPGLRQTTIGKTDEGVWQITAPEGRPHAKVLDDVRAQHTTLRTGELRAEVDARLAQAKVATPYQLQVLSPDEFKLRFSSQQGRASFLVHADGHVTIYARADATPHDIADEAMHLIQLGDKTKPRIGEGVRMLGEATVGHWPTMDLEMRKHLYERKLEVEIDAKQRRLAELRDTDPEWKAINDQLANLRKLEATSHAITPEQLQLMKAAPAQAPEFLRNPAWLFAKETTTKGVDLTAPGVDMSKVKHVAVSDSPAGKHGTVVQVGEPWSHTTVVTSTNTGTVVLDPARPNHVMVGGRPYVIEDGATLSVKDGQLAHPGTVLATELPESYRLVKVTATDGTFTERLEYLSRRRAAEGASAKWVLAGEQSSRRGIETEKAARKQLTDELDAEKKLGQDPAQPKKPDQLVDWMRIEHQNAQGQGFDDVVVEFRGDPPKARIRIIEVKDYPNRNVAFGDMSAIRENLLSNMKRLRREIDAAWSEPTPAERPPAYRRLTNDQVAALNRASEQNDITIELRLGQTTQIGPESRGNSILAKLRAELKSSPEFGGKDVLAGGDPQHVDPKYLEPTTSTSTENRQ